MAGQPATAERRHKKANVSLPYMNQAAKMFVDCPAPGQSACQTLEPTFSVEYRRVPMLITESQVAQVASELKGRRGGVNNDYFGLLFLEKEFHLPREDACEQIAYGGNDFGLDGFHVDR